MMPLVYTNQVSKTITPAQEKMNSFAVDVNKKEIYIASDVLDSSGVKLEELLTTIVEPDFTQSIVDANTNIINQLVAQVPDILTLYPTLSVNIYTALKDSLYKQSLAQNLQTGTVV